MLKPSSITFGTLLRHLRKRSGLTQGQLASAVGYSVSFVSALEKDQRLPDVEFVLRSILPVLALEDEPQLAARLVELAALARGERPPQSITIQRTKKIEIEETSERPESRLARLPTTLIGRELELSQVCDRILHHHSHLITLVGPPGVGKTTLALAVAQRIEHFFRDGAYFVSLAAIHTPDLLAPTILQTLGISPAANKPPAQQVIESLRRKECLLIFDNFEQFLAGTNEAVNQSVGLIAEIVGRCPDICLIVTSRERLRLRAEQRQTVAPLQLAPAVELFALRAHAILDQFVLTNANRSLIEAICQRLDGLPLAIELTAPRVEILSLEQILTQLQHRALDLLSDGARDLPPHHQTLRHTLQQSYRCLSNDLQLLFRQLGVFSGGFTLQSAEAILQRSNHVDLLQSLQSLLTKSLMHRQGTVNEARYSLLETVREFALEKLQQHGEESETRQRHAYHFLRETEVAAKKMGSADKRHYLEQIELELENVRSAWHWFMAHDVPRALRMAAWLKEFWYSRGYVQQGKDWLQNSLAVHPQPSPERGQALVSLAQLVQNQGDYLLARQSLQEAIAIFRGQDDRRWQAEALRELGWVEYNDHQPLRAIEHWQTAVDILIDTEEQLLSAMLYGHVGHVLAEQPNEMARAKQAMTQSITLFQLCPPTHEAAYLYNVQANLCNHEGDLEGVAQALQQAITLHEQFGAAREKAWSQLELGENELLRGNYVAALGILEQALRYFENADELSAIHFAYFHIAQAERKRGKPELATAAYLRAQKGFEQLDNEKMTARCLIGLCAVAMTQGDLLRATLLLTQAGKLIESLPPFLYPIDQRELEELKEQLFHGSY